jgi:8-oxo-dGTP diphosphatase
MVRCNVNKRSGPPQHSVGQVAQRERPFAGYPKPSVAVDVVCLTVLGSHVEVLLYERTIPPQKGTLALPGGFVGIDESLDAAAGRLLRDKAGLQGLFLEQLFTFGDLHRDPRGRVIAVTYFALVPAERFEAATALRFRLRIPWAGEHGGPVEVIGADAKRRNVFLDHAEIIGLAVKRLRGRLNYSPVGFELLPPTFTLRALQDVHEAISDKRLNKDSFRRRMLASGNLIPTGKRQSAVLHRPAELYRFIPGR